MVLNLARFTDRGERTALIAHEFQSRFTSLHRRGLFYFDAPRCLIASRCWWLCSASSGNSWVKMLQPMPSL